MNATFTYKSQAFNFHVPLENRTETPDGLKGPPVTYTFKGFNLKLLGVTDHTAFYTVVG